MGQATFVLFLHGEVPLFQNDSVLGKRIVEAMKFSEVARIPIMIPEGACHFPLSTVVAYAGPSFDTNDAMLLEFDHGRLSRLPLDESAIVENALRRYRTQKANAAKRAPKA